MNCRRKIFEGLAVALVLLLLGLTGCETTRPNSGTTQRGTPPNGESTETRFFPGDRLTIEFDAGLPTPWKQDVREDGSITLPYNKSIVAAGKRKGDLEEAIRDIYVPNILRRLTVNVRTEDRSY